MCGILGIFGIAGKYEDIRRLAIKLSRRMTHRGPDSSGFYIEVNLNILIIISYISKKNKEEFLN